MSGSGRATADVLVVEDAAEFAQLVTAVMRSDGHAVRTATTVAGAMTALRAAPPDLVVLDVGLPDGDGLELCRHIRDTTTSHVLILTGRADEVDLLMGFRFGADDYLTKPFSPRELSARAGAMLARRRVAAEAAVPEVRTVGDLRIDLGARMVWVEDQAIELTRIEFDLLDAMTVRPNAVLSRADLLLGVWGDDHIGDDHVVDVHIANLRKKIDRRAGNGGVSTSHVRTVRGVGYSVPA